ncbi:polysaccharide biosynthesis protein GumN [Sphingomonas oleivorans]|uniref:Polysaccharide biosynthesis protein GumN n=1 Tax=Sphingomonas oleivorans TaxID=1735121 RepID=A0A2T5FW00_9SPHN|nr:TraB/GumN family protein [Sphingomonas oleivorans]PTQ09961.1 polysaccharide biosynthesis protein GumN [Sphingomonas oleivorans]
MKLALAVAALFLAACAPAQSPTVPPAGRPALWKLADEDTTIWLFGTIHVLPPAYGWRDTTIDGAIDGADGLVIETVLDDDPAKLGRIIATIGRSAGLPPLADRVTPDQRAALAQIVARSGIPLALLDGMETWAAALALTAAALRDIGVAGSDGVEPQLTARFRAANKPVEGLETPEQQLGFFDTLPEKAQRAFLGAMLDDPNAARAEFEAMLAAWTRGDEQAIAATFDEEFVDSADLRTALLDRRNANWADWLVRRLDRPGTLFVAVGAGHLAGKGSVQALLGAKGLKVVRVQ